MSFNFKSFSIDDTNTPMKVGVDAVLLGAWASVNLPNNILDVGSGSGVVALMLAQRFPNSYISAIEFNKDAFIDLVTNIKNSPWSERMFPILQDFKSIQYDVKYDLIISNPPYFNDEVSKEISGRRTARHTQVLNPNQLCNNSKNLLNDDSSLIVIFPFSQRFDFIKTALYNNLYLWKELKVKDKSNSEFKRSILHFKNSKVFEFKQEELTLKNEDNSFTEDFNKLTKYFYLSQE
jgi:tRNA1Val (adenine37-N6)-methyltransferase